MPELLLPRKYQPLNCIHKGAIKTPLTLGTSDKSILMRPGFECREPISVDLALLFLRTRSCDAKMMRKSSSHRSATSSAPADQDDANPVWPAEPFAKEQHAKPRDEYDTKLVDRRDTRGISQF